MLKGLIDGGSCEQGITIISFSHKQGEVREILLDFRGFLETVINDEVKKVRLLEPHELRVEVAVLIVPEVLIRAFELSCCTQHRVTKSPQVGVIGVLTGCNRSIKD